MSDGCGGCSLPGQVAQPQAQVAQLQARAAQLERENERLRRIIERLKRIIQRARVACLYYIEQTGEILAHKSGIPRGQWAYARGGNTVARSLLAILSGGG